MQTKLGSVEICLVFLLSIPSLLFAATSAELLPEHRTWLEDLEHPSFSRRQAACQKLAEAGPALFPALGEAATKGDRETTLRIIGLLKQSMRSKVGTEKDAARKSLDRVAGSTNVAAARAAREAIKDIENPSRITPEQQAILNAFQRRQLAFRPGQFQQGFPGMPGANPVWQFGQVGNRVSTTFSPDGSVHLIAQNAETEVKIQKNAIGRISVEVRGRQNGKEIKLDVHAATEAELKTKSPEAFRYYEKYADNLKRKPIVFPAQPGMPRIGNLVPLPFGNPAPPPIQNAIFPKLPALERDAIEAARRP